MSFDLSKLPANATATFAEFFSSMYSQFKKGDFSPIEWKRAKNFFLKHERSIIFTTSVALQLFFSLRLLMAGTLAGAYLKVKYTEEPKEKSPNSVLRSIETYLPKVIKWLDLPDETITIEKTALAVAGVAGSILRYVYRGTWFELSPLVTGIAFGIVLVDIFTRLKKDSVPEKLHPNNKEDE